ncbi:hypothetical protein [Henriciella aquimarina]|uniref:hypothetical protein n=1 Tax=Henriciella aquimarina TaxID=545261 RepID=UPI00117BDCCB|nr:hypothetical protein [Henriciella aquimarina]
MTKSRMPQGTQLAALLAFCLAACLLVWRGNTLLLDRPADPAATTPELARLTSLIEPVLGRDTVRMATHTAADGARTYLLLVDTGQASTELGAGTTARITTILEAAAGFDATRDRLDIQPFAFAPGTTGGLQQSGLIELGLLGAVCALLAGLLVFGRRADKREEAPAAPRPERRGENEPPILRAVPMPERSEDEDSQTEARRLARDNPQETARILRTWMAEERSS